MSTLLADLAGILPRERILARPIDRIAFASDASLYRLVPQAVAQPATVEEVQKLFAYCRANRLPLALRAAGTSLSGQAIPNGLLVELSRYWGGIAIEKEGALLSLQPGVIGSQANRSLEPLGRRIGPDPASIDACMIGGILANNASGMCCGVAENSYRTLDSLAFVLPDGLFLDTSQPQAHAEFPYMRPQLAEGLLEIRRCLQADPALAERVQRKYQTKNKTGYSMNAFLDFQDPLDILAHLLIGSEGTLGFIAEARLRTLPAYPQRLTGLLYFPSVQDAGSAILPLRLSGARALEIMDRAALRAIAELPGMPSRLADLPPEAAALLVEYQTDDPADLVEREKYVMNACTQLELLELPAFTRDPGEQAALWKVRKGLFPTIAALRLPGSSVITEDVAFPVERLAEAISSLQALLERHGYPEAIIYGHAKDGNLHFTMGQAFNDEAEVQRYARFMAALAEMVVGEYDGALKAEHGTGRNMAPFVQLEWGKQAYGLMQQIKELIDPEGFLNPGVVINPDPLAHVRHIKDLPLAAAEIDRCMECGFCESGCPSRRLTLTPCQRIVVLREMARLGASGNQPELLASLQEDYRYASLDTCAVDGLCALACPVSINTGELVKVQRSAGSSSTGKAVAGWLGEHFYLTERAVGAGVRLGHAAGRLLPDSVLNLPGSLLERPLGRRLPRWNAAVPHPSTELPVTRREGADAVYFPACLSRQMGRPAMDGEAASLAEILVCVAERAGQPVWIPPDTHGCCCGMPFSSKGYDAAFKAMVKRTITKFWEWSGGGELPVVIDASSCAYTLLTCEASLEEKERLFWQALTILDPVDFIYTKLLSGLKLERLDAAVVLHPNCALRKLAGSAHGSTDDSADGSAQLSAIAQVCAREVVIPQYLECCAFAGDRGLLFPELTASSAAPDAAEVLEGAYHGYYSSNLTCEMGMAMATGKPYRSILYLLEEASRPQVEVSAP